MKLLLCYGKHPFTTGEFIEKALRKIFECFSCGTVDNGSTHDYIINDPYCDITQEIKNINFDPDFIIFIESGVEFFPINIDKLEKPVIYCSIDSHFNYNWQKNYFPLFDGGLITFKQFIPIVREFVDWTPVYIPHGYDSSVYYYSGEQKIYDISFVGDISPDRIYRNSLLEQLKKLNIKIFNNIWGEDVRKIYSHSKIVFNENSFGVLNPRNFEASACNCVVLANDAIGLDEFFENGKSIIKYSDEKDIVEVAKSVLKDEKKLKEISNNALSVAQNNSWNNRVDKIIEYLKEIKDKKNKENILLSYGLMFFKRKIYSKALYYFQKLLEKEPENYLSYFYLSKIFLNLGDLEKAESFLKYTKQFESNNDIKFLENLILLEKDFNRAFYNLIELNNYYKNYDLKYLLSLLYININEIDKARQELKEAITIDPYRFEAKEKLSELELQ